VREKADLCWMVRDTTTCQREQRGGFQFRQEVDVKLSSFGPKTELFDT
jgi:hypothetical protein